LPITIRTFGVGPCPPPTCRAGARP
jgi:hypothetical protein